MKKDTTFTTADLVGFQSTRNYVKYHEDINQILDEELEKSFGSPVSSLSRVLCQVFTLGVIVGKREERARRNNHSEVKS